MMGKRWNILGLTLGLWLSGRASAGEMPRRVVIAQTAPVISATAQGSSQDFAATLGRPQPLVTNTSVDRNAPVPGESFIIPTAYTAATLEAPQPVIRGQNPDPGG